MARPRKQGLTYFPHDTDACNDEKIHALMALYGAEGYAFYFILLEKVFRTENGRITCGNNAAIKAGLARSICIPPEKFDTILETALEIGAFNKETYDKKGVLTSNGIEKRIVTVNDLRYKERERKKEKEKERFRRKTHGKPTENPETPINKGDIDPTPEEETEEEKRLLGERFDKFWQAYPKKKSKGHAMKVWIKINPNPLLYKQILEAIEKAKTSPEWTKTGGQYIPHPTTWLNGQGWLDEIAPPHEPYDPPRTRHNRELLERMKAEREEEAKKQLSEGKHERP